MADQNKIDLSTILNLIKYSPLNGVEIQAIEDLIAVKLPHVYKDLLRYTNGFSIGDGVVIYGAEEIVERNKTWEVNEYASGYVSIGDDGGGHVFLMLQDAEEKNVFVVDSGDMNPDHATVITSDFLNWISGGCLSEQPTIVEPPDLCDIVLIKAPSAGLKDLLKIKRALGIDISTTDLLEGSRNLPFILVKKFPNGKAKKLIEQLGPVGVALNVRYLD